MEKNDFLYNGMINGTGKSMVPQEMVEIAERLERCHFTADEIKMDICDITRESIDAGGYKAKLCLAINYMITARIAIYDAYNAYRHALQLYIAAGGDKRYDEDGNTKNG